jgi:hypothetical protein
VSAIDRIRAVAATGIFPTFVSAAFGAPESLQYVLFLFGATYGALWMRHK